MQSITTVRLLTLTSLLATAKVLAAQDAIPTQEPRHHKYKFIDLGTFGGPDSIIPFGQRVLTKHGTVIGISETDIPDPFAPNCFSPNCRVENGFKWHDGKVIKLNGLYPDGATTAQAINDRGSVVGNAHTGFSDPVSGLAQIEAVLWRHGKIVNLGTLGGSSSGALSISNGAWVTGASDTNIFDPSSGSFETHAFLWRRDAMQDLGTLGGPVSFGQDVNDNGVVVGFSYTTSVVNPRTGSPTTHPFIWRNGHMTDLTLGGTLGGSAFVNNRGESVGDSTLPGDLEDHAYMWSDGKVHDLGTLGGSFSQPWGLTNDSHVAGVATTTNDEMLHAVLWRDRKIMDIGTVPGDACSWAWGLNSRDQVVGISLPPPCDFSVAHAFLWEDGAMVDLNTLIPENSGLQLVYAESINNAGEIVGIGVPPGISPKDVETLGHAFVLIPENSICQFSDEVAQPSTSEVSKPATTPEAARAATARLIGRFRDLELRRYRLMKR
jgi:probable HAF family extracellular repeat protein